jgi:hypothetical protein
VAQTSKYEGFNDQTFVAILFYFILFYFGGCEILEKCKKENKRK